MSQIEILSFLKKYKRKRYLAIEIISLCRLQKDNCIRALKKLREHKEISFKLLPKKERIGNRKFIYKFKGG